MKNKIILGLKKIFWLYLQLILWMLTIFYFTGSLAFFLKPAGFAALEASLLMAPLAKWQECITLVIPKAWLKRTLTFVFAILTFFSM